MTYQEIKSFINTYIVQNGVNAITGSRLNTALNTLADYYGFDSVVVTTLPAGSEATVNVQGRTLELGIPKGADGQNGRDGLDATNPFKGWFNSLNDLKDSYTASVGDSAYVKDASPATTWSIYVYDITASGNNYWADSGLDADTSNVQTFASNEEVNETYIDDTNLENPVAGSLAKAEDVMQLKAKLEGVTASETKVQLITSGEGQNTYTGTISGTTGSFVQSSQKVVAIPVSGVKSVRMLIATMRESATADIGYSFGNLTSGTKPNSDFSNYTPNHIHAFERVGTESLPLEKTVPVPEDSTWLCVTNWVALLGNSFYAYTQVGDSVVDLIAKSKEYEEQIELVLGNFNDNLGGIKGAITDDSVVMKSFVSNRYRKNGAKLLSISGVRNDEILSIFMYDANMSFLGIVNDVAYIDDLCEFIALRLSKATAYNESVRLLTLKYVGIDKIDKIYYTAPASGSARFITFEVSRTNSIEPSDASYSQNAQRLYTNGYIITPPNYTKDGEPVPLAIFVHGTGGYVFNELSIEYYSELLRFVAKNGYAVVDCCTMTNLYSATTDINGNTRTGYKDTNYPCRLSVDCYVSLYKYVTKMFNIDKERVFVWGKSSGGRLATVIGQSKLLPVKAVATLNGGLDTLTTFRVLGKDSLVAVKKLMEDDMGFTNIPSSFVVSNQPYRDPSNIPSSLIDYLLDNVDKIAGFNPLFTGISNLDIDTYERAQFTCSMAADDMDTSLTDNATIMEQVNKGFKTSLVPTKIWAAQDDENVPYPMAVIYTKLVKRGGGICELRTIPAGNGKHWAVDIAQPNLGQLYPGKGFPNDLPYAPKTSYVTKFGEEISEVTVTYAELVDWFNRW